MATKQNITIPQGAEFSKSWVWKTGDAADPVDLTGYTADAQIRQTHGGTLLFDLQPYVTLGGTTGAIDINVAGSITGTLEWVGEARWDMHLISGGTIERFFEGAAFLSRGVTR